MPLTIKIINLILTIKKILNQISKIEENLGEKSGIPVKNGGKNAPKRTLTTVLLKLKFS